MMLQFPTSVTPNEALETIAAWNGVSTDELLEQIDGQAPENTTSEGARLQFIFNYVSRLWEDWYHLELAYVHRLGSG